MCSSDLTVMICQLVDLYFVAGLGDAAVAGVAAAGNAGFLVNALMQVLGVGTVALIAHAVGRTDRADANLVFNQSIVLSVLCGLLTLVAGVVLSRPYMRAVAADDRTALLMGISATKVHALAWAASSMIAGIGGVFFALSYDLSPAMFQLGLKAFPATILGGLDAVLGSGIGGLLIGITENLAGGYLGSGMKEVAGFAMIIVVLMIRPFGIFGERDIERV